MNYRLLFDSSSPVRVGLIGTGAFGTSFLAQASAISHLDVNVVCDLDADGAAKACLDAGYAVERLAVCKRAGAVHGAVAAGQIAVVQDPSLLVSGPVDLLLEATGNPGAGATHARMAIEAGLHVIMVSKETDSVVGPILSRLAADAGLVYGPGDGDQPALLIQLISWAEMLGFEIICAGKAAEADLVLDPETGVVQKWGRQVPLDADGRRAFDPAAGDDVADAVGTRRDYLPRLSAASVADYCEMAIVMNSTGYCFDRPTLHAPILRITEAIEALGTTDQGGLFTRKGVVDIFNCLRLPDEAGMAGGVFVVVSCRDDATWRMLEGKGHLLDRNRNRVLLYLPRHLLGAEIATSILAAAVLGQSSGGGEVRPMADVAARTIEPLAAGTRLTMDRSHAIAGLRPEFVAAQALGEENAIPYYLAAEGRLVQDVAAGALLTGGMVEPVDPALQALRMEQDRLFGLARRR